jgi:hypothetical protein
MRVAIDGIGNWTSYGLRNYRGLARLLLSVYNTSPTSLLECREWDVDSRLTVRPRLLRGTHTRLILSSS